MYAMGLLPGVICTQHYIIINAFDFFVCSSISQKLFFFFSKNSLTCPLLCFLEVEISYSNLSICNDLEPQLL